MDLVKWSYALLLLLDMTISSRRTKRCVLRMQKWNNLVWFQFPWFLQTLPTRANRWWDSEMWQILRWILFYTPSSPKNFGTFFVIWKSCAQKGTLLLHKRWLFVWQSIWQNELIRGVPVEAMGIPIFSEENINNASFLTEESRICFFPTKCFETVVWLLYI